MKGIKPAFISLFTLLISGCASYNASSLSSLVITESSRSNEVVLASKAFTKSDCKRYLDRDVYSKGYQDTFSVTLIDEETKKPMVLKTTAKN